jgi:hypothetical protein
MPSAAASSALIDGLRWEWITATDTTDYFYDKQTIQYDLDTNNAIDKNAIVVYLRLELNPRGQQKIIDILNANNTTQLTAADASQVSTFTEKCRFDIAKTSVKILSVNGDNLSDSSVLNKMATDAGEQDILPDTHYEEIFKAISAYAANHDTDLTRRSTKKATLNAGSAATTAAVPAAAADTATETATASPPLKDTPILHNNSIAS